MSDEGLRITAKGRELSFPHLRISAMLGMGFLLGCMVALFYVTGPSVGVLIEAVGLSFLSGFACCCGLLVILQKRT